MKKKTKEIYKKCGIEIGNIHRDLEKWTKKCKRCVIGTLGRCIVCGKK